MSESQPKRSAFRDQTKNFIKYISLNYKQTRFGQNIDNLQKYK